MASREVLVVSTMFPNSALPVHAVFVQQRIRALAARVPLRVCSPVPWFPGVDRFFDKYRHRPDIPEREDQDGLECWFPRFTSIPMVAKPLDGHAVYRSLKRFIYEHRLESRIALLDSHLAFPDGWAAVKLGRELEIPVTVTLRGHDINELAATRGRRRMVIEALRGADLVFGVAKALCDAAIELGAPPERTKVASNGVDLERFHPLERAAARDRLGLAQDTPTILSVGHLVERKGFHLIMEAIAMLGRGGRDDVELVIVGASGEEGNYEPQLRALTDRLGLGNRVRFAGAVANHELILWYNAADVFCLSSAKEGWPNVVLESLACGVPVVATAVWGTPEILPTTDLGLLVEHGDVGQLAAALDRALNADWDRRHLRHHAEDNSWDSTAEGLVHHMEEMMADRGLRLPRRDGGRGSST